MSYEAPTLDQFVEQFPEFIEEPSARINAALATAALTVDTTGWLEKSYQPAILWLAAHIISRQKVASAFSDSPGEIASESIGRISVSYRAGGTGFASLSTSMYGSEYLALLRGNHGGPYLI
jgi:hypothetical protein